MLKEFDLTNLPGSDRFIRILGEDGVCYHVIDKALCHDHMAGLAADGYQCKVVSRRAVPPCRFCYFGATRSSYRDASWLGGDTAYFDAELQTTP